MRRRGRRKSISSSHETALRLHMMVLTMLLATLAGHADLNGARDIYPSILDILLDNMASAMGYSAFLILIVAWVGMIQARGKRRRVGGKTRTIMIASIGAVWGCFTIAPFVEVYAVPEGSMRGARNSIATATKLIVAAGVAAGYSACSLLYGARLYHRLGGSTSSSARAMKAIRRVLIYLTMMTVLAAATLLYQISRALGVLAEGTRMTLNAPCTMFEACFHPPVLIRMAASTIVMYLFKLPPKGVGRVDESMSSTRSSTLMTSPSSRAPRMLDSLYKSYRTLRRGHRGVTAEKRQSPSGAAVDLFREDEEYEKDSDGTDSIPPHAHVVGGDFDFQTAMVEV
jgi:hypothetical protein